MSRRFLTFRRFRSLFWELITPAALLCISYRIFQTYPTFSKVCAVFAIIDAFISGLKIGFSYHRWLRRPQDDHNEPNSHD